MANDGDETNSDPKKQRAKQELTVFVEFSTVLQSRVKQLRDQISLRGGSDAQFGLSDKEKQVLNTMVGAGNMEGIIAGVATFVFLRRFPKYLRQRAASKRAAQRGDGYTLDVPGKASPFHNSQPIPNPAHDKANEGGFIWRSFQFTLDLTISTLVGLQVAVYMVDQERMRKNFSEIPLMEGHSAISDHFCGPSIKEYQRQWNYDPNRAILESPKEQQNETGKRKVKPLPPFDRKDILKDPELFPLKALVDFTKNCMKRQALERRIREERGMGPKERVSIPPPGVNSSEWNSDGMDEFSDSSFSGEQHFSGDDEEGDEWSKEDVSSFVSDQEDSKK